MLSAVKIFGDFPDVMHIALLAAAEYQDPLTFKQAMSLDYADEWCAACQYEIDITKKGSGDLQSGNDIWLKLPYIANCMSILLRLHSIANWTAILLR